MRVLIGSLLLGALLAQTSPASAQVPDDLPVPWGSTRRGLPPSWAPGQENNTKVQPIRNGDDARPLDDSGIDGRRDSFQAIQQLMLLVEQHAINDAGRGGAAFAVAAALDKIALGTAVEDLSARLRLSLPQDRPYRAVLLATLSQLYGRAGSYRYELWSLCDALLTVPTESPLAGWIRSRVRSLAGDDARAHRALLADARRLGGRGVAVARVSR